MHMVGKKSVSQINSDLLNTLEGIQILHPLSVHEIWSAISEAKWWAKTSMRRLIIFDSESIIQNGALIGTIAYWNGNITGVLVNHRTG